MEGVQVALLTLAAVLVGTMIPVMAQLWLTLRDVRVELRRIQEKLDPTLDDVRGLVAQARGVTNVAAAVGVAVTAGVRAWRDAKADEVAHPATPEGSPQQEKSP